MNQDLSSAAEARTRFGALTRWRPGKLPDELGVLVALVVLAVVIGLLKPTFFSAPNLLLLVRGSAFFGIMALAMVFLLAVGDIDLSIGANFYLAAVVTGASIASGVDPWLAALIGLGTGVVMGVLNGVIAEVLRVPVLIVTLGTLTAYRGLGLILSDAKSIVIDVGDHPLYTLVKVRVFDVVPLPSILFVVLAIALHILLHRTTFGFRVQAIGSNPEAARLVGLPITRTRLQVLALMGLMCGVAGVLTLAFFGNVDASFGAGAELTVISAVIIGGTPLAGGSGTVIGALLGVLIIAVINSGIAQLGVEVSYSGFVTGLVIIVAIALDRLVRNRQTRRTLGRPS